MSSKLIVRVFAWFALLGVLGFAAPGAATAASDNLLANPGFEEALAGHPWMPAGWDTSRAGLPTVFFGRDQFEVHGGEYAISVASASALYGFANNWSQTLVVGPEYWGKDMVFSAWTRTLGVEGRAYILLQAYRDTVSKMAALANMERGDMAIQMRVAKINDPSINLGWARDYFTENETPWTHRSVRVYVPYGTNVIFVRSGIIGVGQLILDDASLTVEDAQPAPALPLNTNLIKDAGFEGDLLDWEISLPPILGLTITQQNEVRRSGESAMRLEGQNSPSWVKSSRVGMTQVFCNRTLQGKRVRFAGYAKTDSLFGQVGLKVLSHTPDGPVVRSAAGIVGGTQDWTIKEVEADIPHDAYAVWIYMGYSAPTKGIVFLDDLSLTILGDSPQK